MQIYIILYTDSLCKVPRQQCRGGDTGNNPIKDGGITVNFWINKVPTQSIYPLSDLMVTNVCGIPLGIGGYHGGHVRRDLVQPINFGPFLAPQEGPHQQMICLTMSGTHLDK